MNRRWIICPACHGEGHSSAYLGAYSREEFEHSFAPDEQEAYMRGEYDRECGRCSGAGKIIDDPQRDADEAIARRESEFCDLAYQYDVRFGVGS